MKMGDRCSTHSAIPSGCQVTSGKHKCYKLLAYPMTPCMVSRRTTRVGVDRVVVSESLDGGLVSRVARNAEDMGSIPTLGTHNISVTLMTIPYLEPNCPVAGHPGYA